MRIIHQSFKPHGSLSRCASVACAVLCCAGKQGKRLTPTSPSHRQSLLSLKYDLSLLQFLYLDDSCAGVLLYSDINQSRRTMILCRINKYVVVIRLHFLFSTPRTTTIDASVPSPHYFFFILKSKY